MATSEIKINLELIKQEYKNLKNEVSELEKLNHNLTNANINLLNQMQSEFANKVKREQEEVVGRNTHNLIKETEALIKQVNDAGTNFATLDQQIKQEIKEAEHTKQQVNAMKYY